LTLAADCPSLEAWGAFVGEALAAYLLAIRCGECVYIHNVFSRTDLLKYYPINAVTFAFSQEAMKREGVTHTCYGIRSIKGDKQSLNHFKAAMGFEKVLVLERIEINPRLKLWFDGGLARGIHWIAGKYSDRSEFAANINGLVTAYLTQKQLSAIEGASQNHSCP